MKYLTSTQDSPEEHCNMWCLLLALKAFYHEPGISSGITVEQQNQTWLIHIHSIPAWTRIRNGCIVESSIAWTTEDRQMLSLYWPVVMGQSPDRPYVIAHLGQSLDGRIATNSGDSCYITGPANLDHLHRLRALCDAVLVGAGTVARDDPRLTVRRIPGPQPIRIVLDTEARLTDQYRMFTDGVSPLWILSAQDAISDQSVSTRHLGFPRGSRGIDLKSALCLLKKRGITRLFVEGGGITVSRFLEQDMLDRLQITVAPVILGSGRRSINLPVIDTLDEARRLHARHFKQGEDIMFDCDLSCD